MDFEVGRSFRDPQSVFKRDDVELGELSSSEAGKFRCAPTACHGELVFIEAEFVSLWASDFHPDFYYLVE